MNYKSLLRQLEEIADEVDSFLGELERNGKDKGKNYNALLDINCALREIIETDYED